MLKVNYDLHRDHIGMFEPMVADTVTALELDGFATEDVRTAMSSRHELRLPADTVRTLLGRLVRRGYLKREGGRYFRTAESIDVADLRAERSKIEGRQARLAKALQAAAAERGLELESSDEALAMILGFLRDHHVALSFELPPDNDFESDPRAVVTGERLREVVTASFLVQTIRDGGELADVVQEMLEGYILQNVLLLKDIDSAQRRFNDLLVFADSGLLFAALGHAGEANEIATKELFDLLRSTGAYLNVFQTTLGEMRRILAVYEEHLGTHAGRLSLHPTDLTRHFLSERLTPSDIRVISSLLESSVKALGVTIRERPQHEPKWTMDERLLGKMLKAPQGNEGEPRVVHDVDCIAGILTYRRGATHPSIDRCVAVFATGSGITIRNTRLWYDAEGGKGFPPIVHQRALSNYAWLKKPASASRLKVHELVALCAAALRPSRTAWEAFVRHLQKLEESGELVSDEVTAIIASDLTEDVLVELDPNEDSDAASLTEVVERVKASYREASDERERVAIVAAEHSRTEADSLRTAISSRSRTIAKTCSWTATVLLGISLVVGSIMALTSGLTGNTPSILAFVLALVPLALVGLFGMFWGFHLKAWRKHVEEWIFARVNRWLAGART